MPSSQDTAALNLARHDSLYSTWGVTYQGDWDSATTTALTSSSVGMVVLPPHAMANVTAAGSGAETLWGAGKIQEFRAGGRVVLGYLDLTNVVTYTSMWTPGWTVSGFADSATTVAAPTWIGAVNTAASHTNRLVDFGQPGWLGVLEARVDQLIASGMDGLFLDDEGGYRNVINGQFVEAPTNAQIAASAREMRDLVLALRSYIDGKTGTRFKLILNANPFQLSDTTIDGSAPDTVRNAQFLRAIDGIVLENQVSANVLAGNIYAAAAEETAQTEFAANGVPVLSVDNVTNATQATSVIADSLAHGFLPYVAFDPNDTLLYPTFTEQLAQSSESAIIVRNVAPVRAGAGVQQAQFVVTRIGSLAQAATVTWQAAGSAGATTLVGAGGQAVSDTAATAADFVGGAFPAGSVTLAAGVASVGFSVPVSGAGTGGGNLGFALQLAASQGSLVTPSVGGAILDTSTHLLVADSVGGYAALPFTDSARRGVAQAAVDAATATISAASFATVLADGSVAKGAQAIRIDAAVAVTVPATGRLVASAYAATIAGGGSDGQLVVGGNGGIALNAGAGAGTVIANGGANYISQYQGAGAQYVSTGAGNDTVVALGGAATVEAGAGNNLIALGDGETLVRATGDDLVAALGAGAQTVIAGGGAPTVYLGKGRAQFQGGTGSATVVGAVASVAGGGGAATLTSLGRSMFWLEDSTALVSTATADTIIGGAGTATVAASGGELVFGGSGGMQFAAGAGVSTLVGGTGGAMSVVGGTGGTILVGEGGSVAYTGGSGASTVFGAAGAVTATGGSGADIFVGGPGGRNLLAGGSGTTAIYGGGNLDTLAGGTGITQMQAGTGAETLIGGTGVDLFAFVSGRHTDAVIQGFDGARDYITLQNFAPGEAVQALGNATVAGGSETLLLSDGTRIVFAGVTGLTQQSFL